MLSRRTLGEALALGLAAIGVLGCGQAAPTAVVGRPAAAPRSRIAEERPPHPTHLYVYHRRPARALPTRSRPHPEPAAAASAAPSAEEGGGGSIPPASAGTNGSFTPPSGGAARITPRTTAQLEHLPASQSAILLNGIALAPPSAPERIKQVISAANMIVGRPYIWGGGHASWYSRGYDCSGSVSFALAGGGFLRAPLTSGQLESWGAPGPGHWLTVYANGGHVYAVVAGLRWDTVGDARGSGPRWHPALPYPQGFVARHPPGY